MSRPNSELYDLITGLGKQQAEKEEQKDETRSSSPTVIDDDVEDESDDEKNPEARKYPLAERRMSMVALRKASMM